MLEETDWTRFASWYTTLSKVTQQTDRRAHEMCTSIGHLIDEQHDIRKVVKDLARRIDAIQNGTHPGGTSSGSNAAPEQAPPEVGVPVVLEIEDLKKVARLAEQV